MLVDLHTHSVASPDGGISAAQYQALLEAGRFGAIAVTDHNRIDFALRLKKDLGDGIIVGEEIMTSQGEIIGLFLKKVVEPQQTAAQTAAAIHRQGGLVYIPHPFETKRKGLSAATLDGIVKEVDLMEVYNGRAVLQNRSQLALTWARRHHTIQAASSDAHVAKGVGYTYSRIPKFNGTLTPDNCLKMMASAKLQSKWPPITSLLAPKLNRLRSTLRRSA
ncbi:MAG: PHP domain-containing protein [Candidatus Saccharimonadales bacterium]